MPGTPRLDQQTQATPAGKVELHKFSVHPEGTNELFMIVMIRFPEDVIRGLGGAEKRLEVGRQDILSASKAKIRSERPIVLDSFAGLKMEVLPPDGAIIKARIYATNRQLYEASVYVSQARLASADVQQSFDSFNLSAEPSSAGGLPPVETSGH